MKRPAARATGHDLRGHTVLLIDDDLAHLSEISNSLAHAGLEVLIAYDGESGLQQAHEARPHIILLDVTRPDLDGLEICRRLKAAAATKEIPVLFMTTLTGTRDRVRAYEAGAADYVIRPVPAEELLSRVRAHLTLRSMTQHIQEQDVQVQQAIAAREQAETARQITEARLRAIVDHLPFDLWAMDDQLHYIMQNAISRAQNGDMVGLRIEDLHVPEQIKAQWLEQDRRVLTGEILRLAYTLDAATEERHYENIVAPVKVDETIVGLVGMAMDVTERQQTEDELRLYREHLEELVASRTAELRDEIAERTRVQRELSQSNRMLKLLSECNQVLVRAADETGLLEKVCQFIVDLGGYSLTWVGLIDQTDNQTMRLAAHAEVGQAAVADFITATDQLENGPVGRVIRSGQPETIADIQNEPGDLHWQAEAGRQGYASLIALPLQTDDRIIGTLNICAAQPNAFHPEEKKLLLELATDLAYGVNALRTRAERRQAEADLAEQHRLLRTLIDAMPDRIYVKDASSRFLLANKMVAWIMGTTPEEAIGKWDFDFYPHELAEQYYADEQALLASGQPLIDREEPGTDPTGNSHWVSTIKVPFQDEHGQVKGFVGIGRDITVRREMELALRQVRNELEARVEERTRELRQANDQLAGLYRIAQTISAPLQLDMVLDTIMRSTAQLIGSDTGAILLLDKAGETLTVAGAYGLRSEVVRDTRDRVGDSIAGRVVQTGQPIIANDLPHDARFYNPAAVSEDLLACASVPLIVSGKIIGTLDVHSKTDPHAFTSDHIHILSMLASQAAIAIENARLYEDLQQAHADLEVRVQQRTVELAAHYRISEAVQAASNLNELYASIHAIVGELMPADNFYIALHDEAANLIRFPYYADEIDPPPAPARPGAGLTDYVLRSGRPLLAPPYLYAELVARGEIEPGGTPPVDWLGVPLKSQHGKTLGVMAVKTYTEATRLTEAHQAILLFVSHQVAMAITRKRAEAALRESEEQYRRIVDTAHEGVWALDAALRTTFVNARMAQMLGYAPEDLLGHPFDDFLFEEDHAAHAAQLAARRLGQSAQYERRMRHHDGQACWMLISATPLFDDQRQFQGSFAMLADITDRKLGEERERSLARNLRAVVEAVDELINCTDLDTFFRRAVELPREKLGVERSAIFVLDQPRQLMRGTYGTDFQGQTTDQRATSFLPDGLDALLASDTKSWMVEEKEYVYREGDRRLVHGVGQVATTVIRFGSEPIGLFSNDTAISQSPLNEITQETIVIYCSLLGNLIERMRAEEKITRLNKVLEQRTSELGALNLAGRLLASTLDLDQLLGLVMDQIKALVDAEAASVLLCAPTGPDDALPELVFAAASGPAAKKLIGTRMSGATGIAGWVMRTRQSVETTDSQHDPRFNQQIDTVTGMTTNAILAVPLIARGSLVGVMEVINKRSGRFDAHDLEILEALSSSSAIAIDNARLYATEQQRAAALTRALEQQRELDRLQREFIQNVSHELRTPIGIILGYSELLESGELGELHPDQHEPIRIIVRRTQMLRKLVEDITASLEREAHTHDRQHVTLDVAALVQAAIGEFHVSAEKARLTLTAEIEPDVPTIYGDAIALRRLLDNLLGNAFKFTPAGGRVAVRLWSTDDRVMLEVRDTGIGIATNQLERIFDRFYQVDGSATRHYGGMGLGLALVKEIVEGHGGQISVVSEVNAGTTFTITLPAGK